MAIVVRDLRKTVIYWSGMMGNPCTNVEVFLDDAAKQVFVDERNMILCVEGALLNIPAEEEQTIAFALDLIHSEKIVIEPHGLLYDITESGGGYDFMAQQEAGPDEPVGTF